MSPTQLKLAAKAILASAVLHDLVANWRIKRRIKEVVESNDALHQLNAELLANVEFLATDLETACAQRNYLIQKLEEAGVPADEFDLIVLNSLTK